MTVSIKKEALWHSINFSLKNFFVAIREDRVRCKNEVQNGQIDNCIPASLKVTTHLHVRALNAHEYIYSGTSNQAHVLY